MMRDIKRLWSGIDWYCVVFYIWMAVLSVLLIVQTMLVIGLTFVVFG